jgi:hypothetical protein
VHRVGLIAVFFASLVVLAVAAGPASAWFESNNAANRGPATAGETRLTQSKGGFFICSKAEGEWKIRGTGKVTEQTKATKQGPHQNFFISKWGGCSANGNNPVLISPCELQVEQPTKGVNIGTASVASTCNIKVPLAEGVSCEINVTPTNNERLKKVTFANAEAGESTTSNAEVGGLTNTVTSIGGGCEAAGIVAESGNKFKGTVTAKSEKLV